MRAWLFVVRITVGAVQDLMTPKFALPSNVKLTKVTNMIFSIHRETNQKKSFCFLHPAATVNSGVWLKTAGQETTVKLMPYSLYYVWFSIRRECFKTRSEGLEQ